MNWRGVPLEFSDDWLALFEAEPNVSDLAASCPVCGEPHLHRYYLLDRLAPCELNHRQYAGNGGLWEWCSSCRSYEHYSCLVPIHWTTPYLVDAKMLTAEPEELEVARCRNN